MNFGLKIPADLIPPIPDYSPDRLCRAFVSDRLPDRLNQVLILASGLTAVLEVFIDVIGKHAADLSEVTSRTRIGFVSPESKSSFSYFISFLVSYITTINTFHRPCKLTKYGDLSRWWWRSAR